MENELIGRKSEIEVLQRAFASKEAELVAVVGRRRVGKTYLVRSVYAPYIVFELAGLQNANTKKQLKNFFLLLQTSFGENAPSHPPEDWLTAFHVFGRLLDKLPPSPQKRVLFFDELSWLDSRKSGFLEAFGNFWNTWASRRNYVVVICGSAASWMIQKVVHNRGGLHNRITQNIQLQPFTLAETEAFLRSRNINLDRYHILQLYMAMGGVPHYLKEVQPGHSAVQNIERLCFSTNGFLRDEFLKLYPALFEHAENHINIIRALANNHVGLTRSAIIQQTKLSDGGTTTRYLEELEQSGFITSYYPFGKKKRDIVYRLTDEYSLFYLNFIESNRNQGNDVWHHLSQTQHYRAWSGYAFESICLKHIPQIKQALGIAGIYSEASAFYSKGTKDEPGIQVDLLIDRKDQVVNLFELKFYNAALSLDAKDAADLREKVRVFKEVSKTRKQVFLNVIASFGLKTNEHSLGIVDKWFDMNILFE
ncbi:MAG: AAA family ATPase [Saprospiraceae bacterium]|nr:AAA family ATPase [Saprospiraceae bacterium]